MRKGSEYSNNLQTNPFYNIRVRREIHFMKEAFGGSNYEDGLFTIENDPKIKKVTLVFPEKDFCVMEFMKKTGEVEVNKYDKDGRWLGFNDGELDKRIIKTIASYTEKAKDKRELRT